jgi:DNA-binding CsgD family transcriptional regulator
MLGESDYDGAIADLQAAGMGDLPWTSALERLAGRFRTKASVIRVSDADFQSISVASYGYEQEFALAYYDSDLHTKDPRSAYIYKVKPGQVYFDHSLYDVDEMWRDPNVRAACDAIDLRYSLGAMIRLPNDARATVALLSSDREGHPSEHAVEMFRRIAPQIAQSCALGQVLEHESASRSAMMAVLSRKADGMILLDPRGAPTFINDAARAMLAADDGLALRDHEFITRRQPETRRIAQLVHRALHGTDGEAAAGGRALISRPSGRPPYTLTVMAAPPVERFLASRSIGCVIHIQDLAVVSLPSREALREVFGLTDREADFAIELVRCGGLERAAAGAGMAANTARNHLQSISRKTGASGQTEVVQLLGRLC